MTTDTPVEVSSSIEEIELAERLYDDWTSGRRSKSQIEREEWGDGRSHGRRFDRFIRTTLGVQTSKRSRQSTEIDRLKHQLLAEGIVPEGTEIPEWQAFLLHSRSAALQAIRVWNDPLSEFKVAAFSLLFVASWNGVAIAKLEHESTAWQSADGKAKRTMDLVKTAFGGNWPSARFENVRFWSDIRDAVAHRRTPQLELLMLGEAQAGLLNYEETVVGEFGSEYALAAKLTVPLQVSGFRDPGVLSSRKRLEAAIPPHVIEILDRSEGKAYASEPEFRLSYVFLPTASRSGRGGDAQVFFSKPDEVPDELRETLDRYLVLDKPYARDAKFRATEVIQEFQRRTGFHFYNNLHSQVARALGARPKRGQPERTVRLEWAEYISALKTYLYTQRWIDHLVSVMGTSEDYERVTGRSAEPARNMPQENGAGA